MTDKPTAPRALAGNHWRCDQCDRVWPLGEKPGCDLCHGAPVSGSEIWIGVDRSTRPEETAAAAVPARHPATNIGE